MSRSSSPWFWAERNGWFVSLDGQRVFLGQHPIDAAPPRKNRGKWNTPPSIMNAFYAAMTAPPTVPKPAAKPDGLSVAGLLDRFLDWCQLHRSPRTFEWQRDHIQSFLNSLADPTLAVADLKPFHVVEWVDQHPSWSPTYQNGAIRGLQRPFNWAEEMGYITVSPIKRIRKPQPQRRENHATPVHFAELLTHVPEGDPFRDLILFLWHTGCRPQEARHLEARHVQLDNESAVIPKEEAKGRRRARVILLYGPALDIVRRLLVEQPHGKLFRNSEGEPWSHYAVTCRFNRIRVLTGLAVMKQQGIEVAPVPRFDATQYADKKSLRAARREQDKRLRARQMQIFRLAWKHGRKLAAYDLRHGFAQRLLEGGANHLAVAELMGHSNGRMIAETYSHMNRATAHLKEVLRMANEEA